jgi:minor extracellular serine protease Vpr
VVKGDRAVLDAAGNPITRAADGQTLDPTALSVDFMPRNQTAGGYFAISWDGRLVSSLKSGKTSSKTMPNGNYQLRVQVLKALGDPNNPADVETYTSPTFTIARP